jgi:geranylgeranyl pyrophosphate synthase
LTVVALYEPVIADLARVEELIAETARVDNLPVSAILGLVVSTKGKRLRPALACLAGGLHGGQREPLARLAAGIELLHMATLVHDDFVDEAATRRGQPTVHSLYDGRAALLVGDYLFARAASLCAEAGSLPVVSIFARALMLVCDGELRQSYGEAESRPTRADYYRRIRSKTAELFRVATEAGAIIGGCDESEIAALRQYGLSIGVAFQIADDVLDFDGDEKALGKPVGTDLRNGIITLPTILYLERHPDDGEAVECIHSILAGDWAEPASSDGPGSRRAAARVASLVARIVESGAVDAALAEGRAYCDEARATLAELPAGPHREALDRIADYATSRRV